MSNALFMLLIPDTLATRAGRFIDISSNTGTYSYIVTKPGFFLSTKISLRPR